MPTTITRQTGAICRVIDDNLNSWEDHAGQDINIPVAYQYAAGGGPEEWEQGHWSYRGQAALCTRTTDGALVRVRIGDGSDSDRTIYRQIITDPTDPSQWTSWTQLYTGDHYAIAIQADAAAGAGYRIIHSKDDGLYVDNTLKISQTNIIRIKPMIEGPDIDQAAGVVYYGVVGQDTDGERAIDWYYTPDVNAGTPDTYADCANYRTYRQEVLPVLFEAEATDGNTRTFFSRFRSMAHDGGARTKMASEILTSEYGQYLGSTHSLYNLWQNVRFLRGPSGQAGYKSISNMHGLYVDDPQFVKPMFYMFYVEQTIDPAGNVLSNLKSPVFWTRSLEKPYYQTHPTPTGFSLWGLAGAAVYDDYLYLAGNDRVIRRPLSSTSTDFTDYLVEGEYDLPRDNEPATGNLSLANPANYVGGELGLVDTSSTGATERRVQFGLGMKAPTDTDYTFKSDAAWWIASLSKTKDETGLQRVNVGIGDFWHKLSNPYLGTYRQPGRFAWVDWQPETINQLYNYSVSGASEAIRYSPAGADADTVPRIRAVSDDSNQYGEAVVLFSGWRGENGYVKCRLWTWGGVVFRYVDEDNYYKFEISSTGARLIQRVGGTTTTLSETLWPYTEPAGEVIEVYFRWNSVQAWWNHQGLVDISLPSAEMFVGFIGGISTTRVEMSNLSLSEFHQWLTLRELIRVVLAHADEHLVQLEVDEETASIEQIDLLWGPQSDFNTPEKVLRGLLTASQLNIVWKPDDAEVGDLGTGAIHVGRFTEGTPLYTIENEIIAQEQQGEVHGRPNVVAVDGETYSWTEYDRGDLVVRDASVHAYLDLPEIITPGGVRQRAVEELNSALRTNSPGGDVVWQPWFTRMDRHYWIAEDGSKFESRIEGLAVKFSQSLTPYQRATIDDGLMVFCPPDDAVSYVARDLFERETDPGLGDALTGGTWVVYS